MWLNEWFLEDRIIGVIYYVTYYIAIDSNLKTIVERSFRNVPSIAGRYLLVFDGIDFVLMDLVGADQMEF